MAGSGDAGGSGLVMWIALSVLFALFAGAMGGLLGWLGGQQMAVAVLTGGGAFAGVLTLALMIIALISRR